MKFNLKEYQTQKIKQYLKNSNLILFSINANQNSQNWIETEQALKKLQYSYYKIYNNITKKILKNSINLNIANLITSTFFFITPTTSKTRVDNKVFQLLNTILFTLLVIRLNKKLYNITQSKNMILFCYTKNMSILHQFLLTNLKVTHFMEKF